MAFFAATSHKMQANFRELTVLQNYQLAKTRDKRTLRGRDNIFIYTTLNEIT